ncbi:MAG: hypothetical protein JXM70_20420 [Pirellulales bacterium]|nr:hypothetical protein [Pirellulales bacterium]
MMSKKLPSNLPRMDKTALEVGTLSHAPDDREYWQAATVDERLEAMEYLRMINYDYDPATTRLQRVLEITRLGES